MKNTKYPTEYATHSNLDKTHKLTCIGTFFILNLLNI